FTVGRGPADFDPEKAAREAAERATRLIGATKPATSKLTVVLDPFVSAQLIGIIGSALNGDAGPKGRFVFARRTRTGRRGRAPHPRRRPDEPAGLHRERDRR